MDRIDLHVHTAASDGMFHPAEVVRMAQEEGLKGIAITDHDTVAGVAEAVAAGKERGVRVIPGVEISTYANGQDIHVLGYFVNHRDPVFTRRLESLRELRNRRNEMILQKLRELGIDIRLQEVLAKKKDRSPDGNIGRPHIAEVLVDKGVVRSMDEAFDRFLGKDGAAYCSSRRIHPLEAMQYIREAGGVPVLAHPGLYEDDELVRELAEKGLAGMEVYHPDHDAKMERRYQRLALQYGLLVTAGSDFHGERHGSMYHAPLGARSVPGEQVEVLLKAREVGHSG